jgi:hypothetical protein
MAAVLVDSNALLDFMTEDVQWFAWSSATIAEAASPVDVSSLRVSVATKFASQVLPPSLESHLRLLRFRLQ